MRNVVLALLCCTLALASATASAEIQFPKEKDFNNFLKLCGGGATESKTLKAREQMHEWKSNSESSTNLESVRSNLAAVMDKVTPDAEGTAKYKMYLGCVTTKVDQFLAYKNLPRRAVNPGSDVDGFLSLGAAYGSIRTDAGQAVTNDNQVVWIARVGYWFNPHIALGLEGTWWQAKTQTLSLNGQLIQAGQPLRQTVGTATFPLYVHFGSRFPLVLCAGAGLGWESYDYLLLDSNGAVEGKLTNKDSGLAIMVGAGFEFAWTPHTTISVLARGTRMNIDAPTTTAANSIATKARQTVLSLGVALSFH